MVDSNRTITMLKLALFSTQVPPTSMLVVANASIHQNGYHTSSELKLLQIVLADGIDLDSATYNLDPSTNECQFNSVISSNEQSNDANCRMCFSLPMSTLQNQDVLILFAAAGLAEIYAPFSQPFKNTYGLGLCSYLLQSDE